jgi:chorismate mutase
MLRGIRGATTVKENNAEQILLATKELIEDLTEKNEIVPENITSVLISVTQDLQATFPAKALRMLEGWTYVPVMCTMEIPVPGSLPKCIRVMLTAETNKHPKDIEHIYHRDAKILRPDLSNK